MYSRKIISLVFLAIVAITALILFQQNNQPAIARGLAASHALPIGKPIEIEAPLGLPSVPTPADNPPTAETIELGRRLYYDPILSADNTVSCATCHDPRAGFADPKHVSEGVG